MAKMRGVQGVAVILIVPLYVAVGCDSGPTDADGSGGSESGGSGGTASGGGGTGGSPPTGGMGGMGGTPSCLQFDPDGVDCGTCQLSVDQYCSESACSMPEDLDCTTSFATRTYRRGCGYLRLDGIGDVGDLWAGVWVEGTGKLVYSYHNGRASAGCSPETTVGEEPECDSYVDACDNGLGGGGAGGMGGGP
jgi:hypothetical protein